MRAALNFALQSFEGAIVLVSHDRFLLSSVCDDFYLVDAGKVSSFDGDLEDYRKWMLSAGKYAQNGDKQSADSSTTQGAVSKNTAGVGASSTLDRKEIKRLEAQFRQKTKPFTDAIKAQENNLTRLNEQKENIEKRMADSALYEAKNKAELTALLQEQGQINSSLEEAEMLWLEAQESLEEAQKDFELQLKGHADV